MRLAVILTTEVEDVIEAETKVALVRERLADRPEISIQANVTEDLPQPPPA